MDRYPFGLLQEMSKVLDEEARRRRREQSKQRARKGR